MSSHHTQKFFNLYHEQIDDRRQRQMTRDQARQERYLSHSHDALLHYNYVRLLVFIMFAYCGIASALYTGYVLGA